MPQLAPNMRNVVLQVEISRERVPIRNAYKAVGQRARLRVGAGVERLLPAASAPFADILNSEALYKARFSCQIVVSLFTNCRA